MHKIYLFAVIAGLFAGLIPEPVLAQVIYGGGGIVGGINQAQGISGLANADIRETATNLLFTVLSYMALAAVIVIAIAGIYMVVSVGDESAKDRAKKIIGYAAGGLIIIALAAALVLIVLTATGAGDCGLFGCLPAWPTGADPRAVILGVLLGILVFMGLAAVVVIVIGGIYLVLSLGEESVKERVKRIILYAVIGLIIIALAAGIVTLIINATPGGDALFGDVPDIGGSGSTDIRATVLAILGTILRFMGLVAVVVIVIAGIMLVVSGGEEQTKDRAKRIIFYAIIGLIIILLASGIVRIIADSTS